MNTPLVSVILPTLNRPRGLERALQSLREQRLADFEVVVVNDGGPDPAHVLERFRDLLLVPLAHERNKGAAAARNTGLAAARGRYVAYLDDDDIIFPQHLQGLVRALETAPQKAAYADAELASTVENDTGVEVVDRRVVYSCEFDPASLLVSNYIPLPCIMHEKALLARAGRFNEQLAVFEDWDLWIRLSLQTGFLHLPGVSAQYRKARDVAARTNLQSRKAHRTLLCLVRIYLAYEGLVRKHPLGARILEGQRDYLRRQLLAALQRAAAAGQQQLASFLEQTARRLAQPAAVRRFVPLLEDLLQGLEGLSPP